MRARRARGSHRAALALDRALRGWPNASKQSPSKRSMTSSSPRGHLAAASVLFFLSVASAQAAAAARPILARSPEHDSDLRSIHQQLRMATAAPAIHGTAMGARTQLKHKALALARAQRRSVSGGAGASSPLPSHLGSRLQVLSPQPATPGIIEAATFADASGIEDASPGLQRAIETLLKGSGPRQEIWANRTDLSGRRLELGGGQYLLGAPLFIPAGVGNFEIRGGTLRAGPNFPAAKSANGTGGEAFLLTMGESGNATYSPGYVTSVSVTSVLFQGSGIAAGGLHCIYCVGVNIGPAVFVEGFPGTGIKVDLGAEVLIHDCWFTGPYLSTDLWPKHEGPPPPELDHSIAVQINGNDHIVLNSVVWQYTHLGLQVNGAAALVQGIHAWGCGSVWCAQGPNALTGIALTSHQIRVVDCYLDFNFLDLYDPNQIVVASTFFLGTHTRLLAADPSHGQMHGLTMTSNVNYNSVEMQGNFSSPTARARIEDDNIPYVQPPGPKGVIQFAGMQLTTVRRSVRSCNGNHTDLGEHAKNEERVVEGRMVGCAGPQTRFVFNMSDDGMSHNFDVLLLPVIDWMQYSVVFAMEETRVDVRHHAVFSTEGDTVTVNFDEPVLATVFMEARCCMGGMQHQAVGTPQIISRHW